MSDPCSQSDAIKELHDEIHSLAETLNTVAVQKNEIGHIVERQTEHRNWLMAHGERLRKLESQPSEVVQKMYWLVIGGTVGMIASVFGKAILAGTVGG